LKQVYTMMHGQKNIKLHIYVWACVWKSKANNVEF